MKNTPPCQSSRRRLLLGLGAAASLAAAPLSAATVRERKPVVVLTSYNDEVFSRFEAAFEKAWPQYKLQLVWKMPHEAQTLLRQPNQGGIDVYWSASPRNFAALARDGAWQQLGIDLTGLPERIGKASLRDSDGFYTVTEMAGYGFIVNPNALARLQLKPPTDWTDLTQPGYAGNIVLPNPARVGFAPVMIDLVLQAYGWDKGWAVWSAIAGNAGSLNERGSTFVTDEVASGRQALGLTIDFFAASAIANGAPLRFAYPKHSGINPAHIAITRHAANPAGARAFANFVLSEAGQRIITHADIHKLPVRPAIYAKLPADYFNPFKAAEQGVFDYNGDATRNRLNVVAALFEQTLIRDHGELVNLWQRIHRAEAAGKDVGAARQLLEAPLISQEEAAAPALQQAFRARLEGANPEAGDLERQWQAASQSRRAGVAGLLTAQGA
ncbi:MAG: extracellular solute-binding protein [Azonexaceae bacterium]|nr:extracellular solute-binding protein [Azonexaceae bacterium]